MQRKHAKRLNLREVFRRAECNGPVLRLPESQNLGITKIRRDHQNDFRGLTITDQLAVFLANGMD